MEHGAPTSAAAPALAAGLEILARTAAFRPMEMPSSPASPVKGKKKKKVFVFRGLLPLKPSSMKRRWICGGSQASRPAPSTSPKQGGNRKRPLGEMEIERPDEETGAHVDGTSNDPASHGSCSVIPQGPRSRYLIASTTNTNKNQHLGSNDQAAGASRWGAKCESAECGWDAPWRGALPRTHGVELCLLGAVVFASFPEPSPFLPCAAWLHAQSLPHVKAVLSLAT